MTKPDLGKFGIVRSRAAAATRAERRTSRRWATAPSGSAVRRPPSWPGWSPSWRPPTTLQVATGIVNIWTAAAKPVAESFHRIDKAYPGRFLLGIGVGHPEATPEYRKPIDALTEYLDKLDEYGVPKHRRVVAALGPQVLRAVGATRQRARILT